MVKLRVLVTQTFKTTVQEYVKPFLKQYQHSVQYVSNYFHLLAKVNTTVRCTLLNSYGISTEKGTLHHN